MMVPSKSLNSEHWNRELGLRPKIIERREICIPLTKDGSATTGYRAQGFK
jgi:hypothetical protein